jgi:hypothetical protein
MRCSNLWTVTDVIFLVDPKITEDFIWKLAFEDKTFILRACHYYGWDGGTIHQIIDKIITEQKEMGLDKRNFEIEYK